ncbi:hypothetical protein Raf01_00480 [Rugosimonospora africana]|uniref:ADP-heptose:LPS heptosyltransferase n=1 Tax=Rugosimonospora africana TaxID=556532 RepID=A0A8J3VMZ7_9ACTN|nr:hypothetical protein Raf01_00480 [Rugosimonospora africana]
MLGNEVRADAPSRRRALVVLNSGIGNNVIAAPLLESADASGLFASYHVLCYQPFLPLGLADRVRLPGLRTAGLPPLVRRFRPADWAEIVAYVDAERLDLIVNLRLEIPELDGDYLAFRAEAERRGIECWDLHEDGMWEAGSSGERAVALFRRHGELPVAPRTRWLADLRTPASEAGPVGCFVGASRGVKRWQAERWIETVGLLRARGWPVELAAGPGAEERALLRRLARDLGAAVTVAPAGDLDAFAHWISGLGALVGNDTAAIHLAAAIGTPVVSLHLATDGRVWRPVGERVRPLQSALALRCRAMKRDGTCTRLYRGCPAPCRSGVTPEQVAAAVDELRVERVEKADDLRVERVEKADDPRVEKEERWSTPETSHATR